jgi:hypothetical protein
MSKTSTTKTRARPTRTQTSHQDRLQARLGKSKGRYLGIQPIRVDTIRTPPAAQRKFNQAHGDDMAAHLALERLGYPLINILQGVSNVVDGQHRVYALIENGFGPDVIDCEVCEGMTEAEMADIFIGRNDTLPVAPFDKFRVACTARYPRELAIAALVEDRALRIDRARGEGCIAAVGTLIQLHDRFGIDILQRTLTVLRDGLGRDYTSFDRIALAGIGLLLNRYDGVVHDATLITSLNKIYQGIRGLLRRAQSHRDRTGNSLAHCFAASVVEAHNKRLGTRSKYRLPPWWQGAA